VEEKERLDRHSERLRRTSGSKRRRQAGTYEPLCCNGNRPASAKTGANVIALFFGVGSSTETAATIEGDWSRR
jgi:hypothetical protein